MLTIKNYYRLCDKPIGKDGWRVSHCVEQLGFYEIKLVKKSDGNRHSHSVYLHRKLESTWRGEGAYYFRDKDKLPTNVCVTFDWIRDINNLLKTLERFAC